MENQTVLKLNRDNIAIVLVNTITAGNIGSVARAMTNMGFGDLRLVNPQANHLDEKAYWMAHGSKSLLESARVFPDFQKAVADCCLLVAASHKKMRNSQKSFSAREIGPKLIPYCVNNKVAIVFGPENHGLTNEKVNLCTWLVNVPAASSYPALNMSQAAMLICYELYLASASQSIKPIPKVVGNEAMEIFYQAVLKMLDHTKFYHINGEEEVFIGALRRIFGRTGFEEQELKVMYKLFNQFKSVANEQPAIRQGEAHS